MTLQNLSSDTIAIGADHVRRLLFSVINTHQDRLIRRGIVGETARLSAKCPHASVAIDDRVVDETDLGFDSLARLDLVAELTERFGYSETGVEDYLLHRRKIADWIELTIWHLEQRGADATFSFASSGSTGAPSWTSHSSRDLSSEIGAILKVPLAGRAPDRILALVPPQHIYGFLWTVLLPSALSVPVVDLPPGLAGSTLRQARPGDLVVATPYGWEALGKSGKSLPEGVSGISSGGPTTEATWTACRTLGVTGLIEIYGATETAGVGWRSDPNTPFHLADDVLRTEKGLARASSPERAFPLQDDLVWQSERAFRVNGRRDTVVQVAGVNVNLSELTANLRAATGAEDAALRLSGDRLKAFIVADRARAETDLHDFLSSLPAAARPANITWGDALPRTPEGKLADWPTA